MHGAATDSQCCGNLLLTVSVDDARKNLLQSHRQSQHRLIGHWREARLRNDCLVVPEPRAMLLCVTALCAGMFALSGRAR